MRFKRYLKLFEMPYTGHDVMSPRGNRIEVFDAALEECNIVPKHERDQLTLRINKGTGRVPMYDTKANAVFMHNYDDKTSHNASFADRHVIEMLINGMYRHAISRGKGKEYAERLKQIRTPFRISDKVWNIRGLVDNEGKPLDASEGKGGGNIPLIGNNNA